MKMSYDINKDKNQSKKSLNTYFLNIVKRLPISFDLIFNMWTKWRKLRNLIKYGDSDFFNSIEIETSTACNLSCSYCPNSLQESRKQEYINKDLFNNILTQLQCLSYDGTICLHGYNEPLLDPYLLDHIKNVRSKLPKCLIRVTTNGVLLEPKIAQDLYYLVDDLQITIHGNYNEELKRLSFLKTYSNWSKIQSYKDLKFTNRGGALNIKRLLGKDKCIIRSLTIRCDGTVVLCCDDYYGQYTWGNIAKESIVEIWNKSCFKRIRNELKNGIINLPICKKCLEISQK